MCMQEMYVRSRLKSAMVLILKREQIDITMTGSDNTTQRLKGTLKKPLNFFMISCFYCVALGHT